MSADAPSLQASLAALQMTYGIALPGAEVALPDRALVAEAVDRAALAGAFDLFRLTAFVHPDDRTAVRQALAAASDPVADDLHRLRWLKPERRRVALAALLPDPAGLAALLARVRLARSDTAGQVLRRLLRGWRPALRQLSDRRLGALVTALGWLEGLEPPPGAPPLPDARSARMELARRDRARAGKALLADGFVGRGAALAAVRRHGTDPGRAGRVLVVGGPGGIGKSALLARSVQGLARRPEPPAVFTFDFDRPALDPTGPGLTMDLSRQIGLLHPAVAAELSAIRAGMIRTFQAGGGEASAHQRLAEASMRATDEAAFLLAAAIRRVGLDRGPVLFVLDTLEVVAGAGPARLQALNDWLQFARHQLGIAGMRVVVAGRAAETAADHFDALPVCELPPLAPTEAERLLCGMGLDAGRAAAAARVLGGNPLVLRLGGGYLRDHPEAPVAALEEGGAGDAALTEGVLYRRILNHVGTGPADPLRALAYPGLALRVVTPALLQDVVAPALGMTLDGPAEAARLWQRLVDQTWLVDRETDGRARHRRDLRAEMLRLMRRDAAIAPAVARLHGLALAHHRRAADPDLPPDRARLEAVYHALMLLPPRADLPEPDMPLVEAAVAGAFDELPPHAAALARACAGAPPQRTDPELVPAAWRAAVLGQLGWAAVDAERPFEALALDPDDDTPWCWRLTAWQMAADWDSPAARRGLARLSPLGPDGAARWWPHHAALLADPRFAALAPREGKAQAEAAAAWLRLSRGDRDWTPGWSDRRAPDRSTEARAAVLRERAAQALATLAAGGSPDALTDTEALAAVGFGRPAPGDPLLEDELTRLRLLDWAARPGQPGQIGFRPAMVVAAPARRGLYAGLLAHAPAAAARVEAVFRALPARPTTAQLTGRAAQELAEAIRLGGGDMRFRLAAAGLGPRMLIQGLMHEVRPAARALLRPLLATDAAAAALAGWLPELLRLDADGFLPADLDPARWLALSRQADGSRAIAPLVDWAGRTGRLAALLDRAAGLDPDGDTGRRLRRLAAAAGIADRALARLARP